MQFGDLHLPVFGLTKSHAASLGTRYAAAALFLAAAAAKTIYPRPEALPFNLDLVVIEAEIALALALILNLWPSLLWRISVVLFSLFAVVSAYHLLRGDTACGCFGAIAVHPAVTLALDILLVGLLLAFRPETELEPTTSAGLRPSLFVFLLVLIGPGFGIVYAKRSPTSFTGIEDSGFVYFDPAEWIGKQCPLLDVLPDDAAARLRSKSSLVIMHRRDCERCHALLHGRLDEEKLTAVVGTNASVVLIEVPSSRTAAPIEPPVWASHSTQLPASDVTWFVQTPAVFVIDRGVVTQVLDEGRWRELFKSRSR